MSGGGGVDDDGNGGGGGNSGGGDNADDGSGFDDDDGGGGGGGSGDCGGGDMSLLCVLCFVDKIVIWNRSTKHRCPCWRSLHITHAITRTRTADWVSSLQPQKQCR